MDSIKPKAIICEIDGVLADDSHRRHWIDREKLPMWIPDENFNLFNPSLKENPEWKLADWEAYYAAMGDDKPNEWCKAILIDMSGNLAFFPDVVAIYATSRPKKFYRDTQQWLLNINLFVQGDRLFMRPDFLQYWCDDCLMSTKRFDCHKCPKHPNPRQPDIRPAHIVKRDIFLREIKDKYDVLFVLESDEECCKMYRDLGVSVLRVLA